jgi:hypothetical protein
MRAFLAWSALGFFALLIVTAVVFRSRRAKETLHFGARVAWGYIAIIVALAAWRVYQQGF